MPKKFSADQIFPVFMDPAGFTIARYTFKEKKHWDGTDRLYIEISKTDDPLDGTGRDIPKELLED